MENKDDYIKWLNEIIESQGDRIHNAKIAIKLQFIAILVLFLLVIALLLR